MRQHILTDEHINERETVFVLQLLQVLHADAATCLFHDYPEQYTGYQCRVYMPETGLFFFFFFFFFYLFFFFAFLQFCLFLFSFRSSHFSSDPSLSTSGSNSLSDSLKLLTSPSEHLLRFPSLVKVPPVFCHELTPELCMHQLLPPFVYDHFLQCAKARFLSTAEDNTRKELLTVRVLAPQLRGFGMLGVHVALQRGHPFLMIRTGYALQRRICTRTVNSRKASVVY